MGCRGTNMFKRKGRNSSEAVAVAERMPPLSFVDASAWLGSIQQVLYMVLSAARDAGIIGYDPETECWRGRLSVTASEASKNDVSGAETNEGRTTSGTS